MSYPADPAFTRHSENLAAVSSALTQVERLHKNAIRYGDQQAELALRRLHLLHVGIFAEARLRKILADPLGFNDRERRLLWAKRSQDGRWELAVELAARRHYRVLMHDDLIAHLPTTAAQRVQSVLALLRDELAPTITDRNKLAHGQWRWQLKSGSEYAFVATSMSLTPNYTEIKSRHLALDAIGRLVHVLCVSEPTFSRDFDDVTAKIDAARPGMTGRGHEDFVEDLRRRRRPAEA